MNKNLIKKPTHQVMVGSIPIGGGAPIVVQSMTNTDTADVTATVVQVLALAEAGSEIVRVTVNNVTSATGASLMYNVAFMGWHFQANTRFDPANTDLVPSPSAISGRAVGPGASRLASSVSTHTLGGILNVHVDLPGQTTVSLYKLNGGLQQEKTGTGSFEFDTRSIGGGLHILRVQQGAAVYSRTVMF